jgi:hypothetical protein
MIKGILRSNQDFRIAMPTGIFPPGLKALCIVYSNTALKGRSSTDAWGTATVNSSNYQLPSPQ